MKDWTETGGEQLDNFGDKGALFSNGFQIYNCEDVFVKFKEIERLKSADSDGSDSITTTTSDPRAASPSVAESVSIDIYKMSRFWLDEGQMGGGEAGDGVGVLYHLCQSVARTLGKEQAGWQVFKLQQYNHPT